MHTTIVNPVLIIHVATTNTKLYLYLKSDKKLINWILMYSIFLKHLVFFLTFHASVYKN